MQGLTDINNDQDNLNDSLQHTRDLTLHYIAQRTPELRDSLTFITLSGPDGLIREQRQKLRIRMVVAVTSDCWHAWAYTTSSAYRTASAVLTVTFPNGRSASIKHAGPYTLMFGLAPLSHQSAFHIFSF